MLSKEDILKAEDSETIVVAMPEWGDEARMISIKGFERDAFEMRVSEGGTENFRAKLVSMCLVDEKGIRIFNDNEVGELGNKNAKNLNRLFDVACKLCGINEKDVKELEGNSESATSDDSGSSSQDT